jgi:RHS repeat-associated protein
MTRLTLRFIAHLACSLATLAAQASTIIYFHNDLAGSPVVATDAGGQVKWRESYRPYGERLTKHPDSASNDVWFTSRREDVETGLVYMGARYYDSAIGRFLSKDPVEFDEANVNSFNRYAYANNNPYRYIDPDGRLSVPIAGAILLFGAAAAITVHNMPQAAQARLARKLTRFLGLSNESAGGSETPSDGKDSDADDSKPKRVTNPKHHPNSENPEPKNADELLANSVEDRKGVRWAKDADGKIHRFSKPSNGETHWNGSTAGESPIQSQNIPIEVKRTFGVSK